MGMQFEKLHLQNYISNDAPVTRWAEGAAESVVEGQIKVFVL